MKIIWRILEHTNADNRAPKFPFVRFQHSIQALPGPHFVPLRFPSVPEYFRQIVPSGILRAAPPVALGIGMDFAGIEVFLVLRTLRLPNSGLYSHS